jgi:hypothetical protein
VPLTNAVPGWTLLMPQGSAQVWNFVFTTLSTGAPYPISGAVWEYSVRSAPGIAGSPLFSLTTAETGNGVLTVTATTALSQVQMDLFPAATQDLDPGTYYHALWMNPGTTSQYGWFVGQLQVENVAGP